MRNLDTTLEHALELAQRAHDGQLDKAGQDYIRHPLRVMQHMSTCDAKIVALLHDTLEDTWVNLIDLKHIGLAQYHLDALIALTKQPNESRFQTLKRTLLNPLACSVKRADVYDNMNLLRLNRIQAKDLQRYQQYLKIFTLLNDACQFHHVLGTDIEYKAIDTMFNKKTLTLALTLTYIIYF